MAIRIDNLDSVGSLWKSLSFQCRNATGEYERLNAYKEWPNLAMNEIERLEVVNNGVELDNAPNSILRSCFASVPEFTIALLTSIMWQDTLFIGYYDTVGLSSYVQFHHGHISKGSLECGHFGKFRAAIDKDTVVFQPLNGKSHSNDVPIMPMDAVSIALVEQALSVEEMLELIYPANGYTYSLIPISQKGLFKKKHVLSTPHRHHT